MKQYKGAIFDLDGTLLDSMRVWEDIDVAFLKKRGLEVPPDYQEAITPLGFLEAARYTIRRFGFPETPEELIQEWHQMAVDAYTYEVELKDGAAEYLRYLKEKGIRLVAEDTGLNYGRTVELHCDTGEFLIKSVGKPIKTI